MRHIPLSPIPVGCLHQNRLESQAEEPGAAFGFRPFPKRGVVVTNELIDQLREEMGD